MKEIKLQEICRIEKGKQIDTAQLNEKSPYKYINGGIKESGYYHEYNTSGEVVLVSEGGASCGFVNYITENIWCGCHCYRLTESKVMPKYLYYALKGNQEKIMALRSGAAMPNIKKETFKNLVLSLDMDKNAQENVVSSLDLIQSAIESKKTQLFSLDELVKSRFIEMFGEVDTNIKGFPMKRMDECCKFVGGAQPDKKYFEYESNENNIRLIQIRDYKTDKFITYIPKNLARRTCTKNDIMIGRYGPPIFQILGGIDGAYNVALMKAIPSEEFNTEYFRYFLKDDVLLQYIESFSKRTAGQDGVQIDKLNAYPCFVPPIELQNRFVEFVKLIDKSKFVCQLIQGTFYAKYGRFRRPP